MLCPSIFEYRALDKASLKKAGALVEMSGMGKLRSMLGCMRLYERCAGLGGLLLTGFAGGLTPNLEIGDVVEPDVFVEQDYCAEPLEKFPNIIHASGRRLIRDSKRVAMLTQDRFLTENPYRSGELSHTFFMIACDMESYAVAKFCREKKIRVAVVKLISDVADAKADHDFLAACRRLAPKLNITAQTALKSFCGQ